VKRIALVLVLVISACGGSTSAPDESSPVFPTTTAASAGDGSSHASSAAPERLRPEGPDAPDFTLALGQGGEFTLSEEQKPVYMVFWAEW
jgi:hypothetical protein